MLKFNNLNIKHFDISSVTNGISFLQGANNALTTTQYDELLEAWAAQDVQPNVQWHFGDAQYTVETIADWYSPRSNSSLSIINNKLVSIADSTNTFGAAQQIDNLIVGKAYRFVGTATCSNSSANVIFRVSPVSNVDSSFFNTNATGSVTANDTFIATATTLYVGVIVGSPQPIIGDTVTIDAGITVKEITNYTEANAASEIESSVEGNNAVEYKNIPQSARELYSLEDNIWTGSENVTNGDFATDSDWVKGSSWTIGNGIASATESSGSFLYQENICEIGKVYKFKFDVVVSSGVSQCVSFHDVWYDSTALPVGTYEVVHTAVNTGGIRFRCVVGGTGVFAIDNVSVKEVIEVAS